MVADAGVHTLPGLLRGMAEGAMHEWRRMADVFCQPARNFDMVVVLPCCLFVIQHKLVLLRGSLVTRGMSCCARSLAIVSPTITPR